MFRTSQCLFLLSTSNLLMQCLANDEVVQEERHLTSIPTGAPMRQLGEERHLAPAVIPTGAPIRQLAPAVIPTRAPRTLLSRGLAPAVIPTGAPIRQLDDERHLTSIPTDAPMRQLDEERHL